MSDRTSASIEIGGNIAHSKLPELIEAIEYEGCGPDWEGGFRNREEISEFMDRAVEVDSALILLDNQAIGGCFERLEETCRSLGLTYSRADDGYPGCWSASVVFWEPGMQEPRSWYGTESGSSDPHLSLDEIQDHIGQGTLEAELQLMEKAIRVPPFKILKEPANG